MSDTGLTTDVNAWAAIAADELLNSQNADGGWPYYGGQGSSTESTATAVLALSGLSSAAEAVARAANWLNQRQRSDGTFTASASHTDPSWLTPLAAMAMARLGYAASASQAVAALLGTETFTFLQPIPGIYGYDTSIPGWPWTVGGFSWLEPTALAMLFLKQQGQSGSDRVRRGADLLRNRFIDQGEGRYGGWNYGEPIVLNAKLFPTAAPTSLALLALADEPNDQTRSGLNWLLTQRSDLSALFSLGWTAIALNVLNAIDDDWRTTVVSRWSALPASRRGPWGTSLCLLGISRPENHPMAVS